MKAYFINSHVYASCLKGVDKPNQSYSNFSGACKYKRRTALKAVRTVKDLYSDVARAFNNNDVSYIERIASDNITLTIAHEVELIEGKSNVIQYLRDRFQDNSRLEVLGAAELAHMGDQSKVRQEFTNLHEGDLCLRFPKGILKPHGAILILDVGRDGMICAISICVLVHAWAGVVGSGIYPK